MATTFFNYSTIPSSDTSGTIGITLPTPHFDGSWTNTSTWFQGRIYMGHPARGTGTPTNTSSWHPYGFPNSTTVSGTAMATLVSATGVPTTVNNYLVAQFISGPLAASSYTGSGTSFIWEALIYAKLNSAATGCSITGVYKIVDSTGAVLYGTVSNSATLTTTLTAYQMSGSSSPVTITIPANARIVFELGFQTVTSGQAPNVLIRTGDPAATNIVTAGDTTGNLATWARVAVAITTNPAQQMNSMYPFTDPVTTVTITAADGPTKTSVTKPVTVAITATETGLVKRGVTAAVTVLTTATSLVPALHKILATVTCNITAILLEAFYIPGTYRVAVEKIYREITTVIYSKISGKNDGES